MKTEELLNKLNESVLGHFLAFKEIARDTEENDSTVAVLTNSVQHVAMTFYFNETSNIIYGITVNCMSFVNLTTFCNLIKKLLEEGE